MLGVKWDHKLNKWVVYVKATGKIISKWSSKEEAEREKQKLFLSGEEENIRKRNYH